MYVKNGLKQKSLFKGDVKNVDTGFNINISAHVYNDTLTYAQWQFNRDKDSKHFVDRVSLLSNIKDFVEKSIYLHTKTLKKNDTNIYRSFIHYLYSVADIQGDKYLVKLAVDEFNPNGDTIRRAYNVKNIEISPVAVPRSFLSSADTTDDSGEIFSTYSISDLFALVKQYDSEFKPKPVNKHLLNEDGTTKVLYHQTGDVFTVFDIGHNGAGTRDQETPFGIFLKPTDADIGLKGKMQMALYAQMHNPLVVENRKALVQKMSELSEEYSALYERSKEIDSEYKAKADDAEKALNNYIKEFREKERAEGRTPASRKEISEDAGFKEVRDAERRIIDEWQTVAAENDQKAKKALTAALENSQYDGIILKHDEGSFGRSTEAYIVLKSTQVKSATDNIGTFDKNNPNILKSTGMDKLLFESEAEVVEAVADKLVLDGDENYKADDFKTIVGTSAATLASRHNVKDKAKFSGVVARGIKAMHDGDTVKAATAFLDAAKMIAPSAPVDVRMTFADAISKGTWSEMTTDRRADTSLSNKKVQSLSHLRDRLCYNY